MERFGRTGNGEPDDFHLTGTAAIAEVEQQLRDWYGAAYALCLSNATDALRAIAIAIGLKNAEFITTPLTWGGSIAEWLRLENRAHFAALDPLTLTLSPESVRVAITPRTQAILAVDIFGNPADMTTLRNIADEHDLWFISDASQSLGARRDGLPASSLADAWVVSFGTGKGVDAGDGGAILTNNRHLHERLLWETQHPSRQRRELGLSLDNEFASNCRMNPWTAIWLAETLDAQMAAIFSRRIELQDRLRNPSVSRLVTGAVDDRRIEPSFQRIVLSWRSASAADELLQRLGNEQWRANIEQLSIRPLFQQPSFVAQYLKRSSGVREEHSMGVDLSKYFCIGSISGEAFS